MHIVSFKSKTVFYIILKKKNTVYNNVDNTVIIII